MTLTKPQIDAMELLFDDQLTDQAIAEKFDIDVRTLRRWQQIPEFKRELEELHAEYRKTVKFRCVNVKVKRLGAKLDRYRELNRLIRQRASSGDPSVPGDDTGLIIKRFVNTKNGVLIEARVDHATLRELSRLEDELSREAGRIERDLIVERDIIGQMMEADGIAEPDTPLSQNSEQAASSKSPSPLLNRAARRRAMKAATKPRPPAMAA